MPAILFRLRESWNSITSRLWSLIGRTDSHSVHVSLDGSDATHETNHTIDPERTRVFRLQCSSQLLRLEAVSGLHNDSLSRVIDAHTSGRSVKKVIIRNNPEVTTLPASFGKFSNISSLDLSHNDLCDLPWSVVYLRKLTVLNLSHNNFTSIPPFTGHLSVLETLNLSSNDLRYLPTSLIHLQLLRELDVTDNNQLQSPPASVCCQGKDAVVNFLRKRIGRTNLWQNSQHRYVQEETSLKDINEVKSLLELCVTAVLQFKVDYFLPVSLPPPLKRFLHEKEVAKMEAVKLAKCSRCTKYFLTQAMFESHDCQ